jgi:hypothetical protein
MNEQNDWTFAGHAESPSVAVDGTEDEPRFGVGNRSKLARAWIAHVACWFLVGGSVEWILGRGCAVAYDSRTSSGQRRDIGVIYGYRYVSA